MLRDIAIALGALAGLSILLVVFSAAALAWARSRLRAAHYCEFCWTKPGIALVNLDEHEPIAICADCKPKKIRPHFESWLREKGKFVELPKGAA